MYAGPQEDIIPCDGAPILPPGYNPAMDNSVTNSVLWESIHRPENNEILKKIILTDKACCILIGMLWNRCLNEVLRGEYNGNDFKTGVHRFVCRTHSMKMTDIPSCRQMMKIFEAVFDHQDKGA